MGNLSLTAKRLVLGGVVVGLAVAVALLLRSSGSTERSDRSAAAKGAEAERAERQASHSGLGGRSLGSLPQLPPMTEEILAQILKQDKQLGLFMDYHKTVVLDGARREEYHKLLSSPEVMTAMAEALMDPGSGKVSLEEPYRRLMQIDYFEAALAWRDNPQRERVLELTRDIITKDNFSGDQGSDRRQLLGGTKMELYRLLYAQDAGRARDMVAQAKGTRMEPLVSWMAAEELRRRTREAEIQKEVEALQERAN